MHVIWQSFLLVFASEMGDKTQLLALVLVLRFKRPWTILGGILAATLINHGLASWLGSRAAALFQPDVLRWALALIFFAFAAWILVPDKEDELKPSGQSGVFWTTVVAFFLAEMGDKTQLATIALGARFPSPLLVTGGTTLGMLAADGLALAFGEELVKRVPMVWVRRGASLLFALFGAAIFLHG